MGKCSWIAKVKSAKAQKTPPNSRVSTDFTKSSPKATHDEPTTYEKLERLNARKLGETKSETKDEATRNPPGQQKAVYDRLKSGIRT